MAHDVAAAIVAAARVVQHAELKFDWHLSATFVIHNTHTVPHIASYLSHMFIDMHKGCIAMFGPRYGVKKKHEVPQLMIKFLMEASDTVGSDTCTVYETLKQTLPYEDGMDFAPFLTLVLHLAKATENIEFHPEVR